MTRPTVREDLALMEGYHSPQVEVAVRLNTNESPTPPPEEFRRRVADAAAEVVWHRYPDRDARELRERLAALEGVQPDQVIAANGSNEVLQLVCLAYGGAGRRALVFEPTYALHAHIARIGGAEVVEVDRRADFTIDPQLAVDRIAETRPAITFLCSPNNPTGGVEPLDTVSAVLDAVQDVGGLLVVDEAYVQFAPRSVLGCFDPDAPLVVTRTFSKTWSMAAARLGYLIGPSWVVEELTKVVLPYHLDAIKQRAGVIALEYRAEMDARVATLVAERTRIATELDRLGVQHWPSGANFVLFRVGDLPGGEVWSQLVDRSVLVRNCSSWPRLQNCLRVTVGTAEENDRFLSALADIVGA
jgi:histidinol-phosphate aminotransferase